MPDFNAAVAAQVQPPQAPAQPNFAQTLMQASEIQRNKASQALAEAQALQSQRKYNGLMAFSQSLAHNGDTNAAYQAGLAGGADPQDLKNGLDSYSQAKFMQGHGNQDPATALASANIARTGVETNNLAAQNAGIQAETQQKRNSYFGNIGTTLANAPTDENYQAALAAAKSQHISPERLAQLQAADTPEKRVRWGKDLQLAATTPEQANTLHTYTGGQGVTTLGSMLGAPAGNPPQTTQTGAPQAGPRSQNGIVQPPMSPGAVKTQEGYAAQNVADLKEANEKYHNGAEVQSGLMQIQNNLDNVPQGGWYTTGTDAGKRVALAKGINTALEASGLGAPFDKGAIASAEAAQKGTVKLGFDLARSLGSREAQMIVQQSIGVQPGMEMTEQGNRRIMTGLMTAAQRDKDYTQFFQSYAKQNPDMTPGQAQVAFNQAHPPSEYVGNVNKILSLPKAAVDDLRKNPKLAPQFDAKFGGGDRLSRFVLGN